jgi:hypothetical protein
MDAIYATSRSSLPRGYPAQCFCPRRLIRLPAMSWLPRISRWVSPGAAINEAALCGVRRFVALRQAVAAGR